MTFPSVQEAFSGWMDPVIFKLVRNGISDFEPTARTITNITFAGVLEPIQPRKLLVKPEGQRRWKWWTLWTAFSDIQVGDYVTDPSGVSLRVMSKSNWTNAGYSEYELTEGPTQETNP